MTPRAIESETIVSGAEAALDAAATRAQVLPLYAGKELRTGESFTAHADGIAAIVSTLRPDPDLLVAAQLFGVYDVLREPDEWLRARFGPGIAQLVADLRQLMRLSELTRAREAARGRENPADQAEALRRMLLAMANDLRVVL
ncbi:MAG: diphosphokinase, partial [Burkholderiaceae bacterium]|nr:diphosphokinase [Burkholderiaceae bacterium]